MGRVAILGIFNADTTYRAARQPRLGETILGESFALGPGGKGSNQAVAAARAGADARMLTLIGCDAFGAMAREMWESAGVTFAGKVIEGATGAAMIFVDAATGDNAIIVCPGAAGGMGATDVRAWRGEIEAADVFVTQLEQPLDAAMEGLRLARAAGVTTVLNPAPATALPEGLLALCDYVTPNESEAALLSGHEVADLAGAERAARAVVAMGAGAAAVTMGERGLLYCDGDRVEHLPARAVERVIETTGAGDALTGAFAAALAEGQPAVEALRFGIAAAGLSVTRAGAAAAMPARAEIDAVLAR